MINFFYFGCATQAKGHYLWGVDEVGGVHKHCEFSVPEVKCFDAVFCHGVEFHRGHLMLPPIEQQTQGLVKFTRVSGWSIAAWWDRSVDPRGGSNMVFGWRGVHKLHEVIDEARRLFPEAMARVKYALVTWENGALRPAVTPPASSVCPRCGAQCPCGSGHPSENSPLTPT